MTEQWPNLPREVVREMGANAAYVSRNGEDTAVRVTELLVESQRVSGKAARSTVIGQLRTGQRFAESLANALLKVSASQTGAYLDTVQVLLDHSKEQQDVFSELARSSTRACMDFFFSPFLAPGARAGEEPERGSGPNRKSANGRGLPVEDYDRLNVDEVSRRLAGLDAREIEELKTYEKHHKNRTSLIERFDRSLAE